MNNSFQIRIASRALIVQDDKLLFVSHDGKHWYLPGGKPNTREGLSMCAKREVYEETGLIVKIENLMHVLECFDLEVHLHRLTFYFSASITEGEVSEQWIDTDGNVRYRQYFSVEQIKHNECILPRFLANGTWKTQKEADVYQGMVTMKGFEIIQSHLNQASTVEMA